METLQNLLRGPIAALRGARFLAYLSDISRSLRSERLALGPLATVLQRFHMGGKIKVSALPDFDPAEYLKDEEDIAAYLAAILEENDPALLAAALGDIARGMAGPQVGGAVTRLD